MVHPIKTIYNFIITIQLLCLIIFIFYLFDSNLNLTFPITINFGIGSWEDYTFDFTFNIYWLLGVLIFIFAISIVTSINVFGSGINDSGSETIKQFIMFIVKYFVLNFPILFLLSRSIILNNYSTIISLLILLIYFLNFLVDIGKESEGGV